MDIRFEKKVRQARAAQQKRGGGGGRKRCRKGKSCGSSCISSGKVCLVDVSIEISQEIGKVTREITSQIPRGSQRKSKVRELLSQESIKSLVIVAVGRAIKSFTDYIKSNPANDNRANRDALLMLRALRAGISSSSQPATPPSRPSTSRGSTRYSRVPGSSKPIPRAEAPKIVERLKKEIKDLEDRINAIPNDIGTNGQTRYNLVNEQSRLRSQLRRAEAGRIPDVTLQSVYNMQGFNAKPELVQNRSELERSNRILKNSDGSPVILYRGVADANYSDQFKGIGPQGGYHYPGSGIYGDGTYAASAANPGRPGSSPRDSYARDTAVAYAQNTQVKQRVTAFGLRSDAKVLEFDSMREYNDWGVKVVAEASRKTGYQIADPGIAAAALGIHAYRVPVTSGTDYWVILNRGAIVAAIDPEMS